MTSLNAIAAATHQEDLRRAAASRYRLDRSIVLRPARPGEIHIVRRLAELDSAPALEGRVLLAFVDGEAVAGLSLGDGRVVANPFVATSDVVSLLRMRAEHESHRPRRRRPKLRPRFV